MLPKLMQALGFHGFSGTIWTITMEYLLTQLGYFIMLPILPLLLHRVQGLPMTQVGTIMLFFILMIRGSSLLVGNLADRISYKTGILTSLFATAICFALLPLIDSVWLIYLLLAVCGFAISVNFTMSKAMVAADVREASDHVRAFGLLNLFVNVSAAVGPVIGTFFLGLQEYATVLLFISGCYIAAFLLILACLRVPKLAQPEEAAQPQTPLTNRSNLFADYFHLLFRDPDYRRMSLFNLIGWFLYGQLFTGIPLFLVSQFTTLGTQLGTFFTVNAVLIIALQMTVARMTSHLQKNRNWPIERFLQAAYLLFGGSFFLVGASGHLLLLLYVAVAIFTFGEMLFTPVSSTIAASMAKPGQRVLYFNALNISQAVGEGAGVYLGLAVLQQFIAIGRPTLYWMILGIIGVLATILVQILTRRAFRKSKSQSQPRRCPQ